VLRDVVDVAIDDFGVNPASRAKFPAIVVAGNAAIAARIARRIEKDRPMNRA
jgi:hypothetical protein